jgi:hypothetical protein
MPVFKWAFIVIFLFSCSQGQEAKEVADTSTFLVDPISASTEEGSAKGSFANLPTEKTFHFTACLKDVAVMNSIVGSDFQLFDGDKKIPLKSATTDANGCLYWSETFSFAITQKETFFELERTFEALSIHSGRVTVKLAVNPWSKGGDAFRDLRFQTPPAILQKGQAQVASTDSGLFIENVGVDLELVRSTDAVADGNLILSFAPKLLRTGITGAQIPEAITNGKFLIRFQFVALSADKIIPLTNFSELENTSFVNGTVQTKAVVKFLRTIPRESVLELAFEAIPLNSPDGLRPVKGKVNLGRFNSLSISRSGTFQSDGTVAFLEEKKPDATKEQVFGFEVGKIRVSDVVVKELDSSGNPQNLDVEFTACLRNSISHEPILNLPFIWELKDKVSNKNTDGENGCLKWRQEFSFDYFAKETLARLELKVKSNNSFYGNQIATRWIHFNPWNYEDISKMVIDETFDGKPAASAVDTAGAAEMVLPGSYFSFMGRTFEIDDHLNLSTIRRYRFEITPKIRKMTRDKGWTNFSGAGNGRFLLKYLLESTDPDNPQVLDANAIEVESRAGVINATIEFRINDIKMVASRTNLSVEVVPLDKNSALRTEPYTSTFDLVGGFSMRMVPRGSKIDERMKEARRPNLALNKKSVTVFQEAKGHKILDDATLLKAGATTLDIQKYLQTRKIEDLRKLCAIFFDPNAWWFPPYKKCQKEPESYLNVVVTEHINKVYRSKVAGNVEALRLSMSAGVSQSSYESRDESNSKSQSYSINSGLKLSVPLLSQIGLDIGVGASVTDSWTTSTSYSKGSGKSQSRGADLSKSMNADRIEFEIQADVDQCVILGNKQDPSDKNVFMKCTDTPVKKVVKESYYMLYQDMQSSALVDEAAPIKERPFISLIRGNDRFHSFVKVLQDPNVTLQLDRYPPAPAEIMKAAEQRFDGFFPGLLTPNL